MIDINATEDAPPIVSRWSIALDPKRGILFCLIAAAADELFYVNSLEFPDLN
jgi:hypothetical protein